MQEIGQGGVIDPGGGGRDGRGGGDRGRQGEAGPKCFEEGRRGLARGGEREIGGGAERGGKLGAVQFPPAAGFEDGDGIGIKAGADQPGRGAGDDGIGRNRGHGDDGAGTNDGAAANAVAAGRDGGVVAEPDIIFDDRRHQMGLVLIDEAELRQIEIGVGGDGGCGVIGIEQAGGAGDGAVAADAGAGRHAPAIKAADGIEADIDIVVAAEIVAERRAFIFVGAVQADHGAIDEVAEQTHISLLLRGPTMPCASRDVAGAA